MSRIPNTAKMCIKRKSLAKRKGERERESNANTKNCFTKYYCKNELKENRDLISGY
jgi:hypothetical protein